MSISSENRIDDREAQRQEQALAAERADDSAATKAYRRLYAGVRWAPLPAISPTFTSSVLARCGVAEEAQTSVERKLVPTLFAAFGVSGTIAAGPQLAGAMAQLAMDLSGLPWLQFGAAISALGAATAVDRLLSKRRRTQRI